ncbi:MAG TPA: hypothetical protein VGI40_23775 [Pirellulaceae bacterium]|jgi:hypothetical protein
MSPASFSEATFAQPDLMLAPATRRLVNAAEFRNLLVSHRRMIRFDVRSERLRGLRDLDTGEIFVTDERRLLHA